MIVRDQAIIDMS